jgi:hypothetical protein
MSWCGALLPSLIVDRKQHVFGIPKIWKQEIYIYTSWVNASNLEKGDHPVFLWICKVECDLNSECFAIMFKTDG